MLNSTFPGEERKWRLEEMGSDIFRLVNGQRVQVCLGASGAKAPIFVETWDIPIKNKRTASYYTYVVWPVELSVEEEAQVS